MDISNFFNWFIGVMSDLVIWCWNVLDSITFNGISLLDFNIIILLLGALIPLLINLAVTRSHSTAKEKRKARKEGTDTASPNDNY